MIQSFFFFILFLPHRTNPNVPNSSLVLVPSWWQLRKSICCFHILFKQESQIFLCEIASEKDKLGTKSHIFAFMTKINKIPSFALLSKGISQSVPCALEKETLCILIWSCISDCHIHLHLAQKKCTISMRTNYRSQLLPHKLKWGSQISRE